MSTLGINYNGVRDPEILEDTMDDWPDQFEDLSGKQYKNVDSNGEFMAVEDDSYTELGSEGKDSAHLDRLDGILSEEYPVYQENMFRSDPDHMEDNADSYEEYENSVLAFVARRKTASIDPGDMVLIMRPQRYLKQYSARDRVARVIDSMDNGWLVVENVKGEKVAVYAGSSGEDDDIQKLDFGFLESVYKNKIASVLKTAVIKITHKDGEKFFTVFNEKGTHFFGSYKTLEEAKNRLAQIHFFKYFRKKKRK